VASGFTSVLLDKTLKSSTLKLAGIYVIVFCAAILSLIGYVYWNTAAYLYRSVDAAIDTEVALARQAYAQNGRGGVAAFIERHLADGYFADRVYLLVDPAGQTVAGNAASWPEAVPDGDGRRGFSSIALAPGASGGHAFRIGYQVLPDRSRLLIGRDATDLDRVGRDTALSLAIGAALFLLLAAAAALSTSRRSVKRIEAINSTSRNILQVGLGDRVPLRGTRDEWDELAENLNSMLARVEELTDASRHVADNVAHDLRTPLARLRGRLERALRSGPGVDQYRTVISTAVAELDGILTTFSALLRISRIERGDPAIAFCRLDVSELAREVVELFAPMAAEAEVLLDISGDRAVFVLGNRDLLFDAISNLLDNAIKHGGRDREVTVAVAYERDEPVVTIADRGPGIPPEERERVLTRFYRLDRNRGSPGNGLGLSLVAAVAGVHGAMIEMGDNAPGLRVALRFPGPEASPRTSEPAEPALLRHR
jgi:signal transduction histidine kinase